MCREEAAAATQIIFDTPRPARDSGAAMHPNSDNPCMRNKCYYVATRQESAAFYRNAPS